MHHFEIVGQIGRQQFLDQPCNGRPDGAARALAHDIARFVGWGCGMAEQHRHRHTQVRRDMAQVGDRRLGQVTFDLTEPADRTAQRIGHVLQGDAPRLAQRAQVGAQRFGGVGGRLQHMRLVVKNYV